MHGKRWEECVSDKVISGGWGGKTRRSRSRRLPLIPQPLCPVVFIDFFRARYSCQVFSSHRQVPWTLRKRSQKVLQTVSSSLRCASPLYHMSFCSSTLFVHRADRDIVARSMATSGILSVHWKAHALFNSSRLMTKKVSTFHD